MNGVAGAALTCDDRLRLVALNLDRAIGPQAAASRLYRMYGRKETSLFARATRVDPARPPEWPKMPPGAMQYALGQEQILKARQEIERAREHGIEITTWLDEEYPISLRHIVSPPPVLYRRGRLQKGDSMAVAVVGSRRATPDYLDFTHRLGYELAKAGITVVSGLARGVDRAAHEGALAANGRTIAVLGTGADRCYPQSHTSLAKSIAKHGALITYYPLGTPPLPHHFPARNWVIAGMALITVVVQCGLRSGALITAHYAAAQGREVMAVPGDVTIPMSQGPNALLRDGAAVVCRPADVIELLKHDLNLFALSFNEDARERRNDSLSPEERVKEVLGEEILEVDVIAQRLDESIEIVQRLLVQMELSGELVNLGAGRFRRREPL